MRGEWMSVCDIDVEECVTTQSFGRRPPHRETFIDSYISLGKGAGVGVGGDGDGVSRRERADGGDR